MKRALAITFLIGLCLCLPAAVSAQYFGRNKIQYEDFDFSVTETPHFEIYRYAATSDRAVADAAAMAEQWYGRYARVFNYQFEERKPLILYADKPDFQQTNTTPGFISQSTGGFTESLKDRIVLPLTETYAGNNHVIGHELVHAFQFDIAQSEAGSGQTAFNRLPLWFVEGLAEYLSQGRVDPHTAMWMRDAVLRDDLPTLDDLSTDPKYFPYRFGQAFWAFVAGRYGDDIVPALYRAAGREGVEGAITSVLHVVPDSLSQAWILATRDHFLPLVRDRGGPADLGEPLLPTEAYGDDWSLAPVLSPDGQQVVFLSQRDLFSIDLFVADLTTGEVGKLSTTLRNPHFDAIAFLNSSGSWSPDGRRFAFATYDEGDNAIAIADVGEREVIRSLDLPGIGAVYDVAWSPDGGSIAFSGGSGGITDLYRVDLDGGEVEALTEGVAAELQPAWSPDGRSLAFATDRGPEGDVGELLTQPMGLGVLDLASGEIRVLRPFAGAKHINPQYAPDGESLYFISDRGGFSDVYRFDLSSGDALQITRAATGVSGITALSPALSVARETGRLAFSVFRDGGYHAYTLPPGETRGEPVDESPAAVPLAGILPPAAPPRPGIVAEYLGEPAPRLPSVPLLDTRPYDPDLALDYVAPPTAGVAIDRFGAAVGGSIGFFFSDMLGNHQLGLGVQANGTLKDLGGQLIYVDQENRYDWGARAGRTTYRSAFASRSAVLVDGVPGEIVEVFLDRTYFTGGSVMTEYPFSTTRRIEGDLGFTRVSFDREVERVLIVGNTVIDQEKEDLESGEALNLGTGSVAWVDDFSFFGFTSPVRGGRSRFEIGGNTGTLDFMTALADWRRYFFARPFTFAIRGFHLGRYGGDAESERLTPLFVGYPTLVRGYDAGSFEPGECTFVPDDPETCPEFDRLIGSRIAVAGAELRVPLFGTEEFGLVSGGFIPTEVALFADGGVTWTSDESPEFAFDTDSSERIPVFSAGGALRFNFFGSFVAELFYAYPFQRPDAGWQWGFQISPGW